MNKQKSLKRALAVFLCIALCGCLYIPMPSMAQNSDLYSYSLETFTEDALKADWQSHRYEDGTITDLTSTDFMATSHDGKNHWWKIDSNNNNQLQLQGGDCESLYNNKNYYSALSLNKVLNKNFTMDVVLNKTGDWHNGHTLAIGIQEDGNIKTDSVITISTVYRAANKAYGSKITIEGTPLVNGTAELRTMFTVDLRFSFTVFENYLYIFNENVLLGKLELNNKFIGGKAAVVSYNTYAYFKSISVKEINEFSYDPHKYSVSAFTEDEIKTNWIAHRYQNSSLNQIAKDQIFSTSNNPYFRADYVSRGVIEIQGGACESYTQDGSYSSLTLDRNISSNMELDVIFTPSGYQYKQSVAIGMANLGEVNSDRVISVTTDHSSNRDSRYNKKIIVSGPIVGGSRTLAVSAETGSNLRLKLVTFNGSLFIYEDGTLLKKLQLTDAYVGGYAGIVCYNAYGEYTGFAVKEISKFNYDGPDYQNSLGVVSDLYLDGWVESHTSDALTTEFTTVTYNNGYKNFKNQENGIIRKDSTDSDWGIHNLYSSGSAFPFSNISALTYSAESYKYFKLELDYYAYAESSRAYYPLITFGQTSSNTPSFFKGSKKGDNVVGVYPTSRNTVYIAGKNVIDGDIEIQRSVSGPKNQFNHITIEVIPGSVIVTFEGYGTVTAPLSDAYTGGYISLMLPGDYSRFRNLEIVEYNYDSAIGTVADLGTLKNENKLAVVGRADYVDGTGFIMDNPMSGFEFTGNISGDLAIIASKTKESTKLYVEIDGVAKELYVPVADNKRIPLANGIEAGTHTVKVLHDNSQVFGELTVSAIEYNGTLSTPTVDASKINILALGDSITAGAGVYWNENSVNSSYANMSYATLVGNRLNSNLDIVAVEGNTIADINTKKNCISPRDGAPEFDFANDKRDIVIINLGTNDEWKIKEENSSLTTEQISAEINTRAKAIIADIRDKYKDAYIIWVYNMMGTSYEDAYLDAVKSFNDAGDKKVLIVKANEASSGGMQGHPIPTDHTANAELISNFIINNCYDKLASGDVDGNGATNTVDLIKLKKNFAGASIDIIEKNIDFFRNGTIDTASLSLLCKLLVK